MLFDDIINVIIFAGFVILSAEGSIYIAPAFCHRLPTQTGGRLELESVKQSAHSLVEC